MQVKAKHNIIKDGKWIDGGSIFEVDEKELAVLQESVERVGYVSNVFPPDQPEKPKQTRSRKKKEQ